MLERGTNALLQWDQVDEAQRQRQFEGMGNLPMLQIITLDRQGNRIRPHPIESGVRFDLTMQIAQASLVVTRGYAGEQRDQRDKYSKGVTGAAPATRTRITFAPTLKQ